MKRLRNGYFIQTDTNSCGPVATFNVEKWIGREIKNTDWETLGPRRKLCRTSHNNFPMRGTKPPSLSQALSKLNINYTETYDTNMMKKALDNNKCFILLYTFGKYIPGCRVNAHYVFVYKNDKNDKNIHVINDDRIYFKSWKSFREYYLDTIKIYEDHKYPQAWIID